jgi:serine/threonine protein kinase
MADWIGRTLGRVRIESLVARGGMAEVYLGTHTTLQREVAVKILRNIFDEDPRPRERFEREAQAVAKLRHPNIVQVFDFDTIDGQPYIVMEYIRGPSLSKYLSVLHAKNSRLELPQIGQLLTGVANALQYAHESGVVHRDVKPGNILLTSRSRQIVPGQTLPLDFEPVLTDFGLVRFLDSSRQTTVGQTAGTPAYMSPEQAMGLTTDGRTDIYSLGIVLYELLSGDVPFDGETTMSVLLKHLNEAPPPIPGLAPALQAVLDNALAKMTDDRYQTPKEFAAGFNTALEDTTDASTMVSLSRLSDSSKANKIVPVRATPARPRNYLRLTLLGGAVIALVGAAALANGMLPAAATITPTMTSISDTPTLLAPLSLGPTGVLQFHDKNGVLDHATLIAQAMPAPPKGTEYEVWLVNSAERLSLGILSVDGKGKGTLNFDHSEGMNLLASYSGVEVTLKTNDGSETDGSDRVAYAYMLPEAGLGYLRGLMVTFTSAPEQVGLIQGLAQNTELLEQATQEMLSAYENGDEPGTKKNAEALLNLLVGSGSPDHKDWNGDEEITDPGDGYGFPGYIQSVYSYADYAVNSSGASRNMIVNGENVKSCTQNLARLAPGLQDQLQKLLEAASLSDMDLAIQRSAALVDQILNGIDLNENGTVEPTSDECGVLAAREAAYRMADMPLLPVNPLDTPTALFGVGTSSPTATSTLFGKSATPTEGFGQATNQPTSQATSQATRVVPTNPPPQPTNEPPPRATKKPKPTKKPRPTPRN